MPTSMLTTIMIPKWTGSTPSFMAMGNRIGAMIRVIDDGSMTLPASSSRMFTANRNRTTLRSLLRNFRLKRREPAVAGGSAG